MTHLLIRNLTLAILVLSLTHSPAAAQTAAASKAGTWSASGKHGAVAAGGQRAVDAGLEILKSGGNAADAAAATILALSVTDGNLFCFGGEVPILVYDKKSNKVEVLCGLGEAPRLATREYFTKRGGIPGKGIEPAAVPGMLDACLTLLDRHGTKTFADVVDPTLALLDKHEKPWHADLARTIRRLIEAEKRASNYRPAGLQAVATYFYRGPIAKEIDEWSQANGGLIRYADLAAHKTRIEEPVTADYRGYKVCKCGVWTQGPYLLETLQMLGGFDLRSMGHNSADAVHTEVEAMKLALADRDVFYADPLFARVPIKELLSPSYSAQRRELIDQRHASLKQRPGDPVAGKPLLENFDPRVGVGGPSKDTTTWVVADEQGNVIAATPSGFDGALAGKTGVYLGTRLQSFNNWAGHPNCIEPGKRPRITLTPTLVLKDGRPVLAVSVAGGDMQDQATLQLLTAVIDFGMTPAQAVTSPRFGTNHHLGSFLQKPPELGSLILNPDFSKSVASDLAARGHVLTMKRPADAPVMLQFDWQSGLIQAAGDPKARRHAAAY